MGQIPYEYNPVGIPTAVEEDTIDYLSFTANVDNSAIKLKKRYGNPDPVSLEYSTDKRRWNTYTIDDVIELEEGDIVYFRGNNSRFNDPVAYYSFAASGSIAASGNVMSLIDKTCQTTTLNVNLARLFSLCTALTTAPKLPATTLAKYECYTYMFEGCTGLVTAPELPATTLYNGCYQNMFRGCTSLVNAPELPATTLAQNCYNGMFYDCSSLKDAPRLPAKTLQNYCYYDMFSGCSALSSMEVEFTQWGNGQNNWHTYWVQYVNPGFVIPKDGIFRCPKALSTIYGPSRIPYGFTIEHIDDFLEFKAEQANSTLKLEKVGNGDLGTLLLEYSTDKETWTPYTLGTTLTLENVDDKVWMRGTGTTLSLGNNSTYHKFTMTGKIYADGDLMMLIRNEDGHKKTAATGFHRLFLNCAALTHAPYCSAESLSYAHCFSNMYAGCTSLSAAPALPSLTLTENCYGGMFNGCTSLVDAPALPATTLTVNCYNWMFNNCTALTGAPALPAETCAAGCYTQMFAGCTALSAAPELPAMTLAQNCYNVMFWKCSALIDAPELPATSLPAGCYGGMFNSCTSLSSISVGFNAWPSSGNGTGNWVYNVAASGEFRCPSDLADERGNSRIPNDWQKVANDPPVVYISCESFAPSAETGQEITYVNVTSADFVNYLGLAAIAFTNNIENAQSVYVDDENINHDGASQNRSYSAWIACLGSPTDSFGHQRGIALGSYEYCAEMCSPNNYGRTMEICAGGHSQDYQTGIIMKEGEWNHFVQNYFGSENRLELWLNGQKVYDVYCSMNIYAPRLSLGCDQYNNPDAGGGGGRLYGYVSTARAWNRTLSESEIINLSHERHPLIKPTFKNNQLFNFNNEDGAASGQLKYNAFGEDHEFTITSGALPSHVTFDSVSGVFNFDGTTIAQSAQYDLNILLSGATLQPTSANVILMMTDERMEDLNDYMHFTANADNSSVKFTKGAYWGEDSSVTPDYEVTLEYSLDKIAWTTWDLYDIIQLNTGDVLWVRGDNPSGFGNHEDRFYFFKIVGNVNCDGNMMSLLDSTLEQRLLPAAAFQRLFCEQYDLRSAPYLPSDIYGPANGSETNPIDSPMASCFDLCTGITSYVHYPSGNTGMYEGTYSYLFFRSNLTHIETHATVWESEYGWWGPRSMFGGWLEYHSDHGDFYMPSSLPIKFGVEYIPYNWSLYTYEGVAVGSNDDYAVFYSDYFNCSNSVYYAIPSSDTLTSIIFDHPLPSSLVMTSGANEIRFDYDGSNTPISDTWDITLTTAAGYTNVVEAKMTINTTTLHIETEKATFVAGESGTFEMAWHTSPEHIKDSYGFTPVWSITSGTLPSGVTFNNGVFSYDGTPTADTSGVITLLLESSTGYSQSDTKEFTVEVKNFAVDPIIATGITFHMPCNGDMHNVLGQDLDVISGAPSATMVDGVPALYFDGNTILQGSGFFEPYYDGENYHQNAKTTVCIWGKFNKPRRGFKILELGGNYPAYGGSADSLQCHYVSEGGSWKIESCQDGHWGDDMIDVTNNEDWHLYVLRIRNEDGHLDSFMDTTYFDGESRSYYDIPSPSMFTIGCEYNVWGEGFKEDVEDFGKMTGYIADVKIYDRLLTEDEVRTLYSKAPAMKQAIFGDYNVINFSNEVGASTLKINADTFGRDATFTLMSGTFPASVTLNPSGSFSYDGTSIAASAEYQVDVEISGATLIPVTGTVNVVMTDQKLPMPTQDLFFYEPLSSNIGNNFQQAGSYDEHDDQTVDGINCILLGRRTYLKATDKTGFPSGNTDLTQSIWVKYDNDELNEPQMMLHYGYNDHAQQVDAGCYQNGWHTCMLTWPDNEGVAGHADRNWHHLAVTYDYTANVLKLYIDGNMVLNIDCVDPLNVPSDQLSFIIGARGEDEYNCGNLGAYVTAVRLYSRALTADEIGVLSREFIPSTLGSYDTPAPFYMRATSNGSAFTLNYTGHIESEEITVTDEEEHDEPGEPIWHEPISHWDDELGEEVIDEEGWWEDGELIHHDAVTHTEYAPIPPYDLEYSTDLETWTQWPFNPDSWDPWTGDLGNGGHYDILYMNALNDKVYIRGSNTTLNDTVNNAYATIITDSGSVISGGNPLSLIGQSVAPSGCFDTLFTTP